MGVRQREWAKRARLELIETLGGKCVECGTTFDLQLDHIFKREWDNGRVDQSWRISILRREAALGLIEVRCRTHNIKKGEPEHVAPVAADNVPNPF